MGYEAIKADLKAFICDVLHKAKKRPILPTAANMRWTYPRCWISGSGFQRKQPGENLVHHPLDEICVIVLDKVSATVTAFHGYPQEHLINVKPARDHGLALARFLHPALA